MAITDWEKICSELDSMIQRGQSETARERLSAMDLVKVPRRHAVSVALLSYRLNLPVLGLRVLRRLKDPTSPELAEYALGLIRIGAEDEALKYLSQLDPLSYPPIYFYRASVHIARWEYEAAVPLLLKYLESNGLTPYQQIIAQVNLAAAFVYTRKAKLAQGVLEELNNAAEAGGYFFARGKAFQLAAENEMYQRNWEAVAKLLEEARSYIKDHQGLDDFFIRKLEAQYQVEMSGGSKDALKKMAAFQTEAIQKGHWETVRDCDRTVAIVTKDPALLKKLYYGTSLPRFRAQLAEAFGESFELGPTYDWVLKEGKNPKIIDLTQDSIGTGSAKVTNENLLYKVLRFICTDFYRPFRVASLHYFLYPNLKFDTVTSRPKIHRALSRLREWLEECDIPLEIEEKDEFYILSSKVPLVIRVPLPVSKAKKTPEPVEVLKESFGVKPFSTEEASKVLKKPMRTVSRILLESMQEGVIERSGKGPSTKYLFKKVGS